MVSQHLISGQKAPIHDGKQSLELFYVAKGIVDGSEETVLFLHEFPGSSLSFRNDQISLANVGIASISFDFPGFGLSSKPLNVDFSTDYMAQAVSELMTSLQIDSAHIVAQGNSCKVAARVQNKWPHLVSSIAQQGLCADVPLISPNLISFAISHSPLLPEWLLGDLSFAQRFLLLHNFGYASYCALCSRTEKTATKIDLWKPTHLKHSNDLIQWIQSLPESQRQKKNVRSKPRVIYQESSGKENKYGMHDHDDGGHSHDHAH